MSQPQALHSRLPAGTGTPQRGHFVSCGFSWRRKRGTSLISHLTADPILTVRIAMRRAMGTDPHFHEAIRVAAGRWNGRRDGRFVTAWINRSRGGGAPRLIWTWASIGDHWGCPAVADLRRQRRGAADPDASAGHLARDGVVPGGGEGGGRAGARARCDAGGQLPAAAPRRRAAAAARRDDAG
jgi:hypothetical protein